MPPDPLGHLARSALTFCSPPQTMTLATPLVGFSEFQTGKHHLIVFHRLLGSFLFIWILFLTKSDSACCRLNLTKQTNHGVVCFMSNSMSKVSLMHKSFYFSCNKRTGFGFCFNDSNWHMLVEDITEQ